MSAEKPNAPPGCILGPGHVPQYGDRWFAIDADFVWRWDTSDGEGFWALIPRHWPAATDVVRAAFEAERARATHLEEAARRALNALECGHAASNIRYDLRVSLGVKS